MARTPHTPNRHGRLIASMAGAMTLSLFAVACGSDAELSTVDPVEQVTDDSSTTNGEQVLSAADGAAARAAQQAARGNIGALQTSAVGEESTRMAADALIDCGVPYEPTAEEIREANANTDALVAVLDQYEVDYEVITDDFGFTYVQTDYADAVAQSVVDSYWQNRYPVEEPVIEPISPEELARQKTENDALVAALDDVGATYTRHSDDAGWEWIEWDYDNAEASAAIEAVYAELYPPVPPSAEDLAVMVAENDRVAAAFEAAGIAYTRSSDEAGWEWIEWDYDDESIQEAVMAVFNELYPVEPGLPCAELYEGDLAAVSGVAEEAPVARAEDSIELAPEGLEPTVISNEFTPEQIAQRDADVQAMATGFEAAGVQFDVFGESPWASVVFDITDDAAVPVITGILALRT